MLHAHAIFILEALSGRLFYRLLYPDMVTVHNRLTITPEDFVHFYFPLFLCGYLTYNIKGKA